MLGTYEADGGALFHNLLLSLTLEVKHFSQDALLSLSLELATAELNHA